METYTHLRNNVLKMITDICLGNSLRIASSQIQPNIEKIVSEKQCQLSHKK